MIENDFRLKGTLYAKDVRKWVGKKDPTKEGETHYYIVEVPTRKTWMDGEKERSITKTEFIKMKIPWRMSPDDFEIKDQIEMGFYISGREYDKKDGAGKGWINENEITTIKHSERQGTRDNKIPFDNKIPVTAMSDINAISDAIDSDNDPFVGVKTNRNPVKIDEDDSSDLPF